MTCSNLPVTSREYKLLLNTDRFTDRKAGAEHFRELVEFLARQHGGEVVERQREEIRRVTEYYDTTAFALQHHGFCLRLREEQGDGGAKYCLTLKYRAPDRYLAAAQDVATAKKGKTKFEEDILPPFVSKFARSVSLKLDARPDLATFGDLVEIFPGLKALDIHAATALQRVNGLRACEIARHLGKLRFGGAPEVKLCLSFWYLAEDDHSPPLVVEFSYDYDLPDRDDKDKDRLEQYPYPTVEGTDRLFASLQKQDGWVRLHGTTKTAYAYEGL